MSESDDSLVIAADIRNRKCVTLRDSVSSMVLCETNWLNDSYRITEKQMMTIAQSTDTRTDTRQTQDSVLQKTMCAQQNKNGLANLFAIFKATKPNFPPTHFCKFKHQHQPRQANISVRVSNLSNIMKKRKQKSLNIYICISTLMFD